MRKMRVRLFGQTRVLLPNGTVVADFGGARPRQILGILAAAVGTPVSKDQLAQRLWEGSPPRTCTDTIEGYVALLRRRIGVPCGRNSPLATRTNGYVLDAGRVDVDLETFRRLAATTRGISPQVALKRSEAALRLVTGPLLASEPYAAWAVGERDRFQIEYVSTCDQAASHALETGRPQVAVEMARRGVRSDPFSETSRQLLIRGLAASGARSEALRAYLDLRHTFVEALGTEPSSMSQRLYADLLAEDVHESGASPTRLDEVRSLLTLLRHAVDTCPDLDLTAGDRHLAERGERVVA
jgi:DNA-binding SARP family transcriptional activator